MARSVFYDLFPEEQAAALEVRSSVMMAIDEWLRASRLTNAVAAKRLGTSREKIVDLRAGKLHRFELTELEAMRGRIGA